MVLLSRRRASVSVHGDLRQEAQHLSPAVLALDDKGGVGVRILDAGNVVHFVSVNIIKDDAKGIWVTGLPDVATLITIGQEQVGTQRHQGFEQAGAG